MELWKLIKHKKRALFGAGGFASDIRCMAGIPDMIHFIDDQYYGFEHPVNTMRLSQFDPCEYALICSIGDPAMREAIIRRLPKETDWWTYVHPTAVFEEPVSITIGEGSVVSTYSIIVCNTSIGRHAHLNLNTILGHDVTIGDYFTAAPGVRIAGNCVIGDRVHIGQGACVREKIRIGNDVTIGMNAAVVKDITEPGVYVGMPARRIK